MEETPSAITPIQPVVGTSVNSSAHSSEVAPELPPKPLKEIARVLFPYSSLQPDELELKEGDLVIIHSKDCEDKGWWKGEVNNKVNNSFPLKSFTVFIIVFTILLDWCLS